MQNIVMGQICRNTETQNLESNADVRDDTVGGLSSCYDSSVAIYDSIATVFYCLKCHGDTSAFGKSSKYPVLFSFISEE